MTDTSKATDTPRPLAAQAVAPPHEPEPAAEPRPFEEALADGARSAAQGVDTYVHVYPWGAILASAVLGMAVGAMLARG
jgi:hypothetical protein